MTRSLVTIEDLADHEIQEIFEAADGFLASMGDHSKQPVRIRGSVDWANHFVLATLFYEPSTRTRFSFESAMVRLGGSVISNESGQSTSAAKGETIADTVRAVQNCADAIVIRHPWEGAAQVAAEYADVPVINAGDGSHEHPTQALCDLYTLRIGQQARNGDLPASLHECFRDMSVMVCGDLRYGRAVHSLVYALARFGARIIPMPATMGLDFPDHVRHRLARDFGCFRINRDDWSSDAIPADVVYMTPEKPHQLSLWQVDTLRPPVVLTEREIESLREIKEVDALYATRLQKERLDDESEAGSFPPIDSQFLRHRSYRHSQVLHPLPRVTELAYDMDRDERAVYFQQAAYGVPVRMALLAGLLGVRPWLNETTPNPDFRVYQRDDGIRCGNRHCVSAQESEQRYLRPRFGIVSDDPLTIRCCFCDFEQRPLVVSRGSSKKFRPFDAAWASIPDDDLVLFRDEAEALAAGHSPKKHI